MVVSFASADISRDNIERSEVTDDLLERSNTQTDELSGQVDLHMEELPKQEIDSLKRFIEVVQEECDTIRSPSAHRTEYVMLDFNTFWGFWNSIARLEFHVWYQHIKWRTDERLSYTRLGTINTMGNHTIFHRETCKFFWIVMNFYLRYTWIWLIDWWSSIKMSTPVNIVFQNYKNSPCYKNLVVEQAD